MQINNQNKKVFFVTNTFQPMYTFVYFVLVDNMDFIFGGYF